jgi:hypothetical protein
LRACSIVSPKYHRVDAEQDIRKRESPGVTRRADEADPDGDSGDHDCGGGVDRFRFAGPVLELDERLDIAPEGSL